MAAQKARRSFGERKGWGKSLLPLGRHVFQRQFLYGVMEAHPAISFTTEETVVWSLPEQYDRPA